MPKFAGTRMAVATPGVSKELRYIEGDAARTDDGNVPSCVPPPFDHVDVADYASMLASRNRGLARHDARRNDPAVMSAHVVDRRHGPQSSFHAERRESIVEITERFRELLLARNPPREIELTADFWVRVEQRDPMSAIGRGRCAGEPGRTGPDDGDALHAWRTGNDELR